MPEPTPLEIVRWMGMAPRAALPIIVLVVDDRDDDELVSIIARERLVPSAGFGGVWGAGRRGGQPVVALQLSERDGGDMQRRWFTQDIRRELLAMIVVVPHLVAIMPNEVAGDANTAEAVIPRLAGSLVIQVDDRSPQVAEALQDLDDA
jgi:hypothetical protein